MIPSIRKRTSASLLIAVTALAACGNDPVAPDDPAEDLATIRLTIGTETVDLTEGGTATVTIPITGRTVTATFLDDEGATLDIPSSQFELRLIPANTAFVVFTPTGPFAGTLAGGTPGTVNVEVQLWHLVEDHDDFSATLVVTVQ